MLSYIDVLLGHQPIGQRVALIGAGGIGFDVAEFLVTAPGHSTALDLPAWLAEWGVADPGDVRGGIVPPHITAPERQSRCCSANLASWAPVWAKSPAGFIAPL